MSRRTAAAARTGRVSAATLDPTGLSAPYTEPLPGRLGGDAVPMVDFSPIEPIHVKIGPSVLLPEMPNSTKEYREYVACEYQTYGVAIILLLAITGIAFGTAFNSTFRYHGEFFDPEVSTNAHVATICETGSKCARAPARLGTNVSANTRYMLVLAPTVVAFIYILVLLVKYVGEPDANGNLGAIGAFFNGLRPDTDADHLSLGVDLPVMTGVVLIQAVALPLMNFTFVLDNFRIVLMIVVQTCAMLGLHTVAQAMPSLTDEADSLASPEPSSVGAADKRKARIRAVQNMIVWTLYMLYAFVGIVFVGMLIYQLISIDDVGPNLKFNRRMTYVVTITSISVAAVRLVAVGLAAYDSDKWLAPHKSGVQERGQNKPLYKIAHTCLLVVEIATISLTYIFCAYRKWA